jgi:hypothetical protein
MSTSPSLGTSLAGENAMRLTFLCLSLLAACASGGGSSREAVDVDSRASSSATALREVLRDSTSPSRVYLPQQVALPAESIEDFEKAFGATHTGVEPTVVLAVVRGIVDTTGVVERRTLTILPGSDPREGAILFQRAAQARWRPARLADGRAVRQLVEWRFCRDGGTTCAFHGQKPLDRTVPRVRKQ